MNNAYCLFVFKYQGGILEIIKQQLFWKKTSTIQKNIYTQHEKADLLNFSTRRKVA